MLKKEMIEDAIVEVNVAEHSGSGIFDIIKTIKVKAYTPNLPEPPELVKKRVNHFVGKFVDLDHERDNIIGEILHAHWDDEKNECIVEVGIYKKAASIIPKLGKVIKHSSPTFAVAYVANKLVDVLPHGLALCERTIPDDPNCGIVEHAKKPEKKPHGHRSKPSRYKDVPDNLFADPVNYKFPIDSPERVRAAMVYAMKLFNSKQYRDMYSKDEWQYIWNRIIKRALELGISHKYNPNNPLDVGMPEELKRKCDGYGNK
jgi:hypothetical protein